MDITFLLKRFEKAGVAPAIIYNDTPFSYKSLLKEIHEWEIKLIKAGISSGDRVALISDFSPNSTALFLALVQRNCVLVPLSTTLGKDKLEDFQDLAQVHWTFSESSDGSFVLNKHENRDTHGLFTTLAKRGHPGLVLFSSGSTGKSKAAVHDLKFLLQKFKQSRKALRGITFLLFDHIGGINTMFYQLSNGGCMVIVKERTPNAVLKAIQDHNVELIPTSPTFINLILLSRAYDQYDISSLKLVTYGTEPMPESTLKRFHKLFPDIKLQQTYGMSELGILRSKSESSDSLWVKLGGEGYKLRVKDNILQIKSKSTMLGYLNAKMPLTSDGWFITGDEVEQKGEFFRFLGRQSEIINVGGEKVFPIEVESVLQTIENVEDTIVYSETHPIMGQIVCAKVKMIEEEDKKIFFKRIRAHCNKVMQSYKIPVKLHLMETASFGDRFKKMRLAK